MPKSFDEFYFCTADEIEDIETLNDYFIKHKNLGIYHDNMFCPECRQAELSYVPKTSQRRAHLKRKTSSKHTNWCSYQFDYASKKYIEEYLKNLRDDQIKDKLDAMMRSLFFKKEYLPQTPIDLGDSSDENPLVLTRKVERQVYHKTLRRKSIEKWLDKELEDELHLFYGKVRLSISEWHNEQGYTLYFLNIFCKDSNREWKKKASIYLGNKVLLKVEEDADYYLVAIGHLDFSKGFPPKLKLASRQALSIEKVV